MEKGNVRCQALDFLKLVRRDKYRQITCGFQKNIDYLFARHGVEPAERLIKDKNLWVERQRAGERHLQAHAV
jgi:hypothetical protein